MTQQAEDADQDGQRDLQRLFDETAADAPGPLLTKLAARAADVPMHAQRGRFLPRWAWGPALAGALVAFGGLLLAVRGSGPRSAEPSPSMGLRSALPVARATAATASAPDVTPAAPDAAAGKDDEPSEGPELLGDAEEGARFDVSGPQSDRDLDAWLAATKELSGGT